MEDFESLDLAEGMFSADSPSTLTATVGRLLPDGSVVPVKVEYAVVDGKAVHQGDIVIGDADVIAAREKLRHDDHLALVMTTAGATWPGGIIPINSDAASARLLAATISYFKTMTPFQFVPHGGQQDYLYVQAGNGSDSRIGRQGGIQIISVGPGSTVGTLAHELCHALGLWHEQCRPDRDSYITINQRNILPGYANQFAVQTSGAASVGPYDVNSIMHYPGNAYARPGTMTITRKDGGPLPLRNGLSAGDIAGLRELYPAIFH